MEQSWHIKYYKGLGTNTAVEAKEYFQQHGKHTVTFAWDDTAADALDLGFDKTKADARKEWLATPPDRNALAGGATLRMTDFVNHDLWACGSPSSLKTTAL